MLPIPCSSSNAKPHSCSHGLAVQVFTAMTGVNVITYYQTIMYKALGITGSRNTLVAGIYNCVGPLANLIFVVFFLDRVGRRKPLLFGTVAISIALTCEAILTAQNPDGQRIGYSIGGVFFLFAVSVAFSVSFGPCSWYEPPFYLPLLFSRTGRVYMAEVMPMQIRSKGNAFAVGIGNWAINTVWNQVSPIALGQIQWRLFFVFVAWSVYPLPLKVWIPPADRFPSRSLRVISHHLFLLPRD